MSRAAAEGDEKALSAAVAGFESMCTDGVTTQVRRVANGLQFAVDLIQNSSTWRGGRRRMHDCDWRTCYGSLTMLPIERWT
jgi:hypothetical protein